MGGELWLRFDSTEGFAAARALLRPIGGGFSVDDSADCWLEWHADQRRLAVCFTTGALASNTALAFVLGREVARRFLVARVGMDSIGWMSDRDWTAPTGRVRRQYGAFRSWAEWLRAYDPKWQRFTWGDLASVTEAAYAAMDERVVERLRQLDQGVLDGSR
jgi:hypothetical protein